MKISLISKELELALLDIIWKVKDYYNKKLK